MFRITAETCRTFTLAEILILAAMNLECGHADAADVNKHRVGGV